MDGLDHRGDTQELLKDAIQDITRIQAEFNDDEPEYRPDPGKTAFVVKVYDDGERGLKFTIGGVSLKSGSSTFTIEWGDGTSTTTNVIADSGSQDTDLTHTYS